MPNFSTTFFNSTIPELSNTYSELEISNDSENGSQMTSLHMNTSHPLNTTVIQKIERMAMGEYNWLSQTS